ncbi:MAG: ribonuclease J [bacterium]|nr:ribonuclease J [bacterium]
MKQYRSGRVAERRSRAPARTHNRPAPRQNILPAVFRRAFSKNAVVTPKKGSLRIIPIGGVEEVGRNMTLVEYKDDILIVDMGLQFPEEDMPGIDYIIPNIQYLRGKEKNIRGVIITHGHYDHIGAIPHLSPKLGNPDIYGTDLTIAIIKKRQEEYGSKLNTHVVTNDSKLKLGSFRIEFFGVSHNIPASLGVIIRTPEGVIVHTGDFKIDEKSDIAGVTELDKMARLAEEARPLLLLSDSTNAREAGSQFSEIDIKLELEKVISDAKGRLIIGTFASLLGRIKEIIQIAIKHKKKIVIEGRSMRSNIEIAKELGYLTLPKEAVIQAEDIHRHKPHEIIVLATGAQGEDRAVMMRIANREHRAIRVEKGDTFLFSSSVVPGNERSVQRLTDKLYREGAEVINYKMLDIHAGGHAKQEDLKKFMKIVKAKYVMPIEGNHSFLKIAGRLAREIGYDEKQVLFADNGQVAECKDGICHMTNEKVPSEYVFVDGLGVGDVGEVVLRDRQMLSEDGIFVIIAIVDSKTGKVRGSPDIISRGFIYLKENQQLLKDTRQKIKQIVEQKATGEMTLNPEYIKNNLRDKIGQFLFSKTERRPMVLPVVIEV